MQEPGHFQATSVPFISGHWRKNGTKGSSMNTVDNVARVLRLFTPERGVLSVTEVAQQLGLPKSSTSRLLKAMAEAGLLASARSKPGHPVGNLIFQTARRPPPHPTPRP